MTEAVCRYGNPTTRVVEEKIKELEGAEDCLVSSSGIEAHAHMNASTQHSACVTADIGLDIVVHKVAHTWSQACSIVC